MKIGIITIPDFNNYGNRLQNYALQKVIKSFGYDGYSYVPYMPNIFKKMIRLLQPSEKDSSLDKKILNIKKLYNYIRFDKMFVHSREVGSHLYPSSLNCECDYFVAGSDQIWNPNWYTEYSFLKFSDDKKKIAYAASFGCDKIPENKREEYFLLLNKFKTISVRENTGRDIIEDLIGIDVPVVLDPTLLLATEEWEEIEKKPRNISFDRPYILTYFLGERDKEQKEYIENVSCEYNMRIFNLLDYTMPEIYIAGPSEFLYLLHHAAMVCTDSFHASVFSIIFHTPFIVFERNGNGKIMGNRIDTLLSILSLENHKYQNKSITNIFDIDYDKAEKIVEEKTNLSLSYLRKAFED